MQHHILIISDGGTIGSVFSAVKESDILPNIDVYSLNTFYSENGGHIEFAERPSLILIELSDKDGRAKILDELKKSMTLHDIPVIHIQTTTSWDETKIIELIRTNKYRPKTKIHGNIDKKEMVLIPAGTYKRRKGLSQKYLKEDEHQMDSHTGAFYIDKYPVTNAEYHRFILSTHYTSPRSWENGKTPRGKDAYPVTGVNWDDVLAYAEWAGKIIPSIDEWEKAAFGANGLNFPWGDEFNLYKCNTADSKNEGTTPVNFYDERGGGSTYGVSDVIGNVWEWVYDSTSSPNNRILVGGAWDTSTEILIAPSYARVRAHPLLRGLNFGFRLILPLEKYLLHHVKK
jgi:formylglycine-generating enzyme required for sulfatase activity